MTNQLLMLPYKALNYYQMIRLYQYMALKAPFWVHRRTVKSWKIVILPFLVMESNFSLVLKLKKCHSDYKVVIQFRISITTAFQNIYGLVCSEWHFSRYFRLNPVNSRGFWWNYCNFNRYFVKFWSKILQNFPKSTKNVPCVIFSWTTII